MQHVNLRQFQQSTFPSVLVLSLCPICRKCMWQATNSALYLVDETQSVYREEQYLKDGAWLWEAGRGGLRGHAGCHGLSRALRLRQRWQWQWLGECLEDGAWLGQATCTATGQR